MHSETPAIMEEYVATGSRPSNLRMTDLRVANLAGVPFRSSIIRIDTNQGLVGYGEVRDQASATYALMLKSRLVGENPCNVDKIFRKIKQFGFHGRQGGGVSGVEMALMDLAGKAYGVPAYALIGGRFRDEIRCYADTPSLPDPHAMGARLLERKQRGFTMLKMDVGIDLLWDVPGALIAPAGARAEKTTMHPFTGIQVTAKGVEHLASYVDVVRSVVGYDIALAADHFGHIALDSCIRIGRALEPFTLAWIEDLIPWQLTDQWRQLTTAVAVPTCTGEDIYLLMASGRCWTPAPSASCTPTRRRRAGSRRPSGSATTRRSAGSRWRCTWRRRRSRRWRACTWPPPQRTSSHSNTTQPTWSSGATSSPTCRAR